MRRFFFLGQLAVLSTFAAFIAFYFFHVISPQNPPSARVNKEPVMSTLVLMPYPEMPSAIYPLERISIMEQLPLQAKPAQNLSDIILDNETEELCHKMEEAFLSDNDLEKGFITLSIQDQQLPFFKCWVDIHNAKSSKVSWPATSFPGKHFRKYSLNLIYDLSAGQPICLTKSPELHSHSLDEEALSIHSMINEVQKKLQKQHLYLPVEINKAKKTLPFSSIISIPVTLELFFEDQ